MAFRFVITVGLCGVVLATWGGWPAWAEPVGGPGTLLGVHFYENPLDGPGPTDVEEMSAGQGIWLTEVVMTDPAIANFWERAEFKRPFFANAVGDKGHALILRIQPGYGANVPHPDDPFTLEMFATEAADTAHRLRDLAWIWQVGNEVNIRDENLRWNPATSLYDGARWEPSPEEYAATYLAVRDAIHSITPEVGPGRQIVLMQPVSPGGATGETGFEARYFDGYEFLYRQIRAIEDHSKIDGFALHGYAQPGGANFGVDGYMDSIREQIMIIESLGLGDRPIFVTEFNKHMPNADEAAIGARFLVDAYDAMAQWNAGSGGGSFVDSSIPNANIIGATWFVYNSNNTSSIGADIWNEYSLEYWKTAQPNTSHLMNPWYAFRHAAEELALPVGVPRAEQANALRDKRWFESRFADGLPDRPRWIFEPVVPGSSLTFSDGAAIIRGNGNAFGGGAIWTSGYSYNDFRAKVDLVVGDASRSNATVGEANFDVRFRQRDFGYSLTFFTSDASVNPGRIVLRRANNWDETIGAVDVAVEGGINTLDRFEVDVLARAGVLMIRVSRDGDIVLDAVLTDPHGQRTGRFQVGSYNLGELRVERVAIGGPDWDGVDPVRADAWSIHSP